MPEPLRRLRLEQALLPDGWAEEVTVGIAAGRFVSVETSGEAGGEETVRGAALPGLPNLHSHAFQRGMAGLAERRAAGRDSFWTWRETMYGFLAKLTPEDVEAIAAQAFVEMLESGFTTLGEFHYLHHDPDGRTYQNPAEMGGRIAIAAAEAGIGLTLLPVFYAQGGFGGEPPGPGQRRFVTDPERFAKLLEASGRAISALPDARLGIAPHSLRAVTPESLDAVVKLHPQGPVHIHVAEQVREVEDCLAWSGQRPVARLLDHAEVDGRWCLIHATHMSEGEVSDLAGSGAVAGLCPITEANLGDGLFEAAEFIGRDGRIGVGSDSNVHISAAEELRLLEYGQRLRDRERNRLAARPGSTGRQVFEAALAGGAQALGHEAHGIAEGARADLVILDTDHPNLAAASGDALLDCWIFSGGTAAIHEVWAAGKRVVEAGRHVAREPVAERFRAVMKRLAA